MTPTQIAKYLEIRQIKFNTVLHNRITGTTVRAVSFDLFPSNLYAEFIIHCRPYPKKKPNFWLTITNFKDLHTQWLSQFEIDSLKPLKTNTEVFKANVRKKLACIRRSVKSMHKKGITVV